MKKQNDPIMMQATDEVFWAEFEQGEERERYVVYDKKTREVIVASAHLLKEQKKIKV